MAQRPSTPFPSRIPIPDDDQDTFAPPPRRQYPLHARGERITGTPVKRAVRGPACEADVELALAPVATMDVFLDGGSDISAVQAAESLVVNAIAGGVRFRLHLTCAARANLATEIERANDAYAKQGSK